MSVANDALSVAAFGVEEDSSDDSNNIVAHDPPTTAMVDTEELNDISAEQHADSFENDIAVVRLTASCLREAIEVPRGHDDQGSSRRATPDMTIPSNDRSSRAPLMVGSASRAPSDAGGEGVLRHNESAGFSHDAWQLEEPPSKVIVSGETTEMGKSPHSASLDTVTPLDCIGTRASLPLPALDVMKSTCSGSATTSPPAETSSTALKHKDVEPMAEAESKVEANHVGIQHIPSSSLILCRRDNGNRRRASASDWDTDTCSSSAPTERLELQESGSSNATGGNSQQMDATQSEQNTGGAGRMAEIAAVTIPGRRSVISSKFFKLFSAAQSVGYAFRRWDSPQSLSSVSAKANAWCEFLSLKLILREL